MWRCAWAEADMLRWSPLMLTLAAVLADRRRTFFRVPADIAQGVFVDVDVGTPPNTRTLSVETRTPHLVIMDSDCWDWKSIPRKCPPYCKNGKLRSIYCSRFCQPIAPALQRLRCGSPEQFNANESKSLKNTDEDVFAPLRYFRPIYGRRAFDRVAFQAPLYRKAVRDEIGVECGTVLDVREGGIVRGLSFDKRYFTSYSDGLLGLAPTNANGQSSLIPQLKAAGRIDSAIVSIQYSIPPVFNSGFEQLVSHFLFGALDQYSCEQWKMFKSEGSGGWSFQMENVKFIGQDFGGINIGRIALESTHIGIPAAVGEHFLRMEFFHSRGLSTYWVSAVNRSRLGLEFSVGNHRIQMNSRMLTAGMLTLLAPNGEVRYSDDNEWTFGGPLLEYFCFGYDYERGAVGWATRRRINVD